SQCSGGGVGFLPGRHGEVLGGGGRCRGRIAAKGHGGRSHRDSGGVCCRECRDRGRRSRCGGRRRDEAGAVVRGRKGGARKGGARKGGDRKVGAGCAGRG